MKTATTTIMGIVALLVACMNGISIHTADYQSKEHHISHDKPVRTVSALGEERRSKARRERLRDPESEFSRYLSKIEPITDFDDTSSGFFQGYLLSREAEKLIVEDQHLKNREAVQDLFEKSYAYFIGIRQTSPDWKDRMVLARLEKTRNGLRDAYFANNVRR